MLVFLNGRFVPESEAVIPVNDRGFLYGDGLFETIRVCNGRAFRLGQHLEPENWTFASWVGRRSRNDINRLAPMLPLPLGPLRKLRPGKWQHARSCNLGIWRRDFNRVDGFDADYSGWGRGFERAFKSETQMTQMTQISNFHSTWP